VKGGLNLLVLRSLCDIVVDLLCGAVDPLCGAVDPLCGAVDCFCGSEDRQDTRGHVASEAGAGERRMPRTCH